MWLSGQQKRPADSGEGQTGIVTMSGGEMAVMMDCERRGVQVYAPAGYRWTPKVGQRVLVIQGQGEIPCVGGARQDGDGPDQVAVTARQTTVQGDIVRVAAGEDVVVEGENVRLMGQVYVGDETLEEMIRRIVLEILGGM